MWKLKKNETTKIFYIRAWIFYESLSNNRKLFYGNIIKT